MTNEQLYLATGVPMIFNATLFGVFLLYSNARYEAIEKRFAAMDQRFDSINQRFEDLKELWRAELRRVEEILEARLKHLEERR